MLEFRLNIDLEYRQALMFSQWVSVIFEPLYFLNLIFEGNTDWLLRCFENIASLILFV